MSRLVKLRHVRCGETSGHTYAIPLTDRTDEEIYEAIEGAKRQYLDALAQAWNDAATQPNTSGIEQLDHWPHDITVGEAQTRRDEVRNARREYARRRSVLARSFGHYLREAGFRLLDDLDDDYPIEWGHRHGTLLDLSNDVTDYTPRKGP